MMDDSLLTLSPDGTHLDIGVKGDWTMDNAPAIERLLSKLNVHTGQYASVRMHCDGLGSIDTTGAWLLYRKFTSLESMGISASFEGFREIHFKFVKALQELNKEPCPVITERDTLLTVLHKLGETSISGLHHLAEAFTYFGRLSSTLFHGITHLKSLRFNSIVLHIRESGVKALPIVSLMAFLIAIVLVYQGAAQLRQFGAEIYTVDLVAISVLREMGVLLTSIMVAGRSGSSFAAEIGVMKLNDEVDALETIGIDPFEVLVLPRVIALIIALPIMTFVANICGLAGGALMSVAVLDISWNAYVTQLANAVTVETFFVGMIKAPVFAFIIASVGTYRGMQASGSAESVGRLTTIAVVQAAFLVILADAAFSILFEFLGI